MSWEWEKNPPFNFRTADDLNSAFGDHCERHLREIYLAGTISKQRILDVFQAWKEDLERSKERSFREEGISPGHIKAAAFLTYWLRREAPIVNLSSSEGQYSELTRLCIEFDVDDDQMTKPLSRERLKEIKLSSGMSMLDLLDNRKRAYAYSNELFAFTFGLNLAKAYEEQSLREKNTPFQIATPSKSYVEDICYLFKFKSVSPHAIDLVYRALLMVRRPVDK